MQSCGSGKLSVLTYSKGAASCSCGPWVAHPTWKSCVLLKFDSKLQHVYGRIIQNKWLVGTKVCGCWERLEIDLNFLANPPTNFQDVSIKIPSVIFITAQSRKKISCFIKTVEFVLWRWIYLQQFTSQMLTYVSLEQMMIQQRPSRSAIIQSGKHSRCS